MRFCIWGKQKINEGYKTWKRLVFYHDELPLFVNKECRAYMEEKGILKHWLLPEFDLNEGTIYFNRPIGNSPDMNPLYCTLFKDLHEGVKKVILFTRDTSHKRTCDRYKTAMQCYNDTWKTCPSSERIIHDIDKIATNMHTIYKYKGVIIDKHVKNSGRRYVKKAIREAHLPRYCVDAIIEKIDKIKEKKLIINK